MGFEHIERQAQGDIEEILLRMVKRLLVHAAAERGQDAVTEQQIDGRQDQARYHRQRHSVAHASARVLLVPASQADADIGTAAVADHHRYCQRHDGQGKDHRVSGVAVGAEVVGVGNKDLVHNVVKRRYQQ